MLPQKHPVLRHRGFVIESPPLKEFETTFFECLEGGELSLCLHGTPRVGKTSALYYIAFNLQSQGRAAIRKAIFEQQQSAARIDRADFWRKFLGEGADGIASWRSPASARTAVINGLMVDSDRIGTDCVILMIDEAQNLLVHQYSMLKVLLDELIDLKRSPFLLLAAQPEIQHRPDELLKKNFHDLVDRFFTRWHRMRGLKFSELAGFVSAYDSLRWSPDRSSGATAPTFTEFFAPRLAHSGGLVVLAPHFADAFRKSNRESGRQAEDELETKYVFSAIRIFLLEVSGNAAALSSNELAGVVQRAVQRSGIFENRRRVGDAEHLFELPAKKRARLER